MQNALTEADVAAVREVWDALLAANTSTDFDTFATHCTDDLVHLDPRSDALVGVGPWKEWANAQEFGDVDMTLDVEELSGDGDLAYLRWGMVGTWSEGGEQIQSKGKGISLFRRTPEGWRLSHNIWNSTP
jgi:ketosteroid isomerase-like protein